MESITEKIKDSDREIEQIARKDYPETALLQQVGGVGPLIALTFVLTVEDKSRFQKSRDIGCYVGCGRGAAIRDRANRSYESARRGIPICGRCWRKERTTSSAVEDLIPI